VNGVCHFNLQDNDELEGSGDLGNNYTERNHFGDTFQQAQDAHLVITVTTSTDVISTSSAPNFHVREVEHLTYQDGTASASFDNVITSCVG
jgi:hypothetical protein